MVVEFIIFNGLGRFRMISFEEFRDYKEFIFSWIVEDDEWNKFDRGEICLKNFDEIKFLNFFNLGGICF